MKKLPKVGWQKLKLDITRYNFTNIEIPKIAFEIQTSLWINISLKLNMDKDFFMKRQLPKDYVAKFSVNILVHVS